MNQRYLLNSVVDELLVFKRLRPSLFNKARKYAIDIGNKDVCPGRYMSKRFEEKFPGILPKLKKAFGIPDLWLLRALRQMKYNSCKVCGSPCDFHGDSMLEYCSAKCRAACPEFKAAKVRYNLKTYGVKCNLALVDHTGDNNPNRRPEVRAKIKATNLRRYGVENTGQSRELREKAKATYKARTGYDHQFKNPKVVSRWKAKYKEVTGYDNPMRSPEVKAKTRKTNLKRYGVDNPARCPEVLAKIKNTYFSRTGYYSPAQNPEVVERTQRAKLKRKVWLNPLTGEAHNVLGFEPIVLEDLVSRQSVARIETRASIFPKIEYTNLKGTTSVYHPDIAVKLHNGRKLVVEVKEANGLFYWDRERKRNRLKFSAANKLANSLKDTNFMLAFVHKDRSIEYIVAPNREKLLDLYNRIG